MNSGQDVALGKARRCNVVNLIKFTTLPGSPDALPPAAAN